MSHLLASFSECDPMALDDITGLMKALRRAIAASGVKGTQSAEERFTEDGFTATVTTGESRATLRSIPRQNACVVEFTCEHANNAECFATEFGSYLRAKDSNSQTAVDSTARVARRGASETRRSA